MTVPRYFARARARRLNEAEQAQVGGRLAMASQGVAQMGEGLQAAGAQMQQQARERHSRAETIARVRDGRAFFEAASQEFTRLQSEEDLSNDEVLKNYDNFLKQQRDQILANHKGGPASRDQLTAQFEAGAMRFQAQAAERVQRAQKEMVAHSFNDGANMVFADVLNGGMTMDEALARVDGLADEHSGAIPSDEMMEMLEAAQSTVIAGAMDNFAIAGDWDGLEAMVRDHPEVAQTLPAEKVQHYIRSIQTGRREKAQGVMETIQRKRGVLASLNVSDPSQLSPDMRFFYETGKELPAAAKEDISPALRIAREAEQLKMTHGPNSSIYRTFTQAAGLLKGKSGGSAFNPASKIGKLYKELGAYQEAGLPVTDPRVQGVMKAINQEDPEYQAKVEKLEAMPAAQMALESVVSQAQMMEHQVNRALMLATGVDAVDPQSPDYEQSVREAETKAAKKEFAIFSTGIGGSLWSFWPPVTAANNLQATLETIGANTMFSTMQELRDASPTGSTGLGALSEAEGQLLRAVEGSLSQETPRTTAQTLMRMKQDIPAMAKRQTDAFMQEFGDILPPEPQRQQQPAEQRVDVASLPSMTLSGGVIAPPQPSGEEQIVQAFRSGQIDRESAAQQILALRQGAAQ